MSKYTIGIDFGSLSGRAVIIDAKTGQELASAAYDYPHKVMDKTLPDGTKLGNDWALQHPQDYLDVLGKTVPEVLKISGVKPEDVIGIGTDFTACTILPVKNDGTPLCFLPEFKSVPHAYVKLWKHHSAQEDADLLNKTAQDRGEAWLANYGGKISSEWGIPKLMQIAREAPEIYNAMDRWIEAADWIVWQLTGNESRNSCTAGYKEIWNKKSGYPGKEFFKALNPLLENCVQEKLGTIITPLGNRAGGLSEFGAKLTGLNAGIAVAIGNVDAHVCVPSVGIDGPGKMLAIMGTSTCHMLLGDIEKQVPGMCGVVEDGIMPGFFGYEAGQSCVGDHFAWLVEHICPGEYMKAAKQANVPIQSYLSRLADLIRPGESGLLALDWWNGNRSVLVDVDLSGLIIGMTMQTKAEEIYRALIEATAYGTRMIIENFRENGVPVNEFYASGGISQKNPLVMQIYSDVLNMPIKISDSAQGPALGSAMFASVAAGDEKGGYDDIFTAARNMGKVKDKVYSPNNKNVEIYNTLFAEYKKLHDYFGRGSNDVMKTLKKLKTVK